MCLFLFAFRFVLCLVVCVWVGSVSLPRVVVLLWLCSPRFFSSCPWSGFLPIYLFRHQFHLHGHHPLHCFFLFVICFFVVVATFLWILISLDIQSHLFACFSVDQKLQLNTHFTIFIFILFPSCFSSLRLFIFMCTSCLILIRLCFSS